MNSNYRATRLQESDREDMEIFLERIHQLMPVLGADALLPIGSVSEGSVEKEILACEIKGLKATGHLTPTGFCRAEGIASGPQGTGICPPVPVYPRVAEKLD